MLNPLQDPPRGGVTTALEHVAGDRVAKLRAHEHWASSPDALACYWDELFNAVCARLEQLAQHSVEPPLQSGVRECVAALAQLHAKPNSGPVTIQTAITATASTKTRGRPQKWAAALAKCE